MASLVDSAASFGHRLVELGFDESVKAALAKQDLNTFAALAFASSTQPGQIDEDKFNLLVKACFGDKAVTLGVQSQLRRLIFEAITCTVQSISQRVSGGDDCKDSKMPPQERDRRLADQRERLPGLLIRNATEPAHGLVDKFVKMLSDACLKHVPLHSCVSREDELCHEKNTSKLLTIEHNQLVLKSKDLRNSVDLSCPLHVQQAMTRRALAADQAGLITFQVLDAVTHSFLSHLSRAAPPGFARPTVHSLVRADQELWKLVADEAGSKIHKDATGGKPLDAMFKRLATEPAVLFHLLPTPAAVPEPKPNTNRRQRKRPRSASSDAHSEDTKRCKPKKHFTKMPKQLQGLLPKNKKGEALCFNYNLPHGCKEQVKGHPPKCGRGLHQCMRCGRTHGQHECPNKD